MAFTDLIGPKYGFTEKTLQNFIEFNSYFGEVVTKPSMLVVKFDKNYRKTG